ncbi:hypothetical protein PIB30_040615 [Stylosanthes scabra]|uniref:Uncharacterized protein n=1 Tax=Stylosanthes scabra TaxID=79078 RepID=A0ABU6SFC9_9FABA|nr:hypothetical protein [Stylosanthes scabra]
MRSGIIYYEYEKREKFEDYDLKADAELGTFKIRCYHFDNESFVHPFHSVRFDPDRPYEVPIEVLMAGRPLRESLSLKDLIVPDGQSAGKMLRPPKSWELIPSSEGWMCEGNEEEKEIGGMKPTVEMEEASEKEEDEEDPEEEVPASTSLPMDIDATEDYLQFIEELGRHPEYSPIHSGHASVPDSPKDLSDQHSDSHGALSYDLSGVWPPPSSDPSL